MATLTIPYAFIPLTKGYFAIVDAEDFDDLCQYHWQANSHPRVVYATRGLKRPGKGNGKSTFTMHRHIMNATQGVYVDHINHDGLDNRKANLRICTPLQNVQHSRLAAHNTSGYRGVMYNKHYGKRNGRWQAILKFDGSQRVIGSFHTAEEAARAFDAKAREVHGEFAVLNFSD